LQKNIKENFMKKVLTLLLATGLVFSVAACAADEPETTPTPAPAPVPKPAEPATPVSSLPSTLPAGITIEFWHSMSGPNGEAVQFLVDKFNEENTYGITVKATYQGGYGDAHQKVTAALVAGEYPNLGQAYGNNVITYFPSDKVVQLDEFINDPVWGIDDFEDIISGYRKESSAFPDGGFYTLPFSKSTEVLYYNPDFFNKTGEYADREGDVFTPPTTWDELEETAKAITAITGKPSFGYDSLANLFITWTQQNGGAYTSETGGVLFNNDQAIEALEFFVEGVEGGYFRVAGDDRYLSGPFVNGDVMMYIGSTSGSVYNESDLFEYASAQVPMGEERKVIQQGANFFMLDQGENENLATFLFLKFVMATENTAEWSMRSGYLPVRDSARDLPVYKEFLESGQNPTKVTGASYEADDYIFDAIFAESYDVRVAVGIAVEEVLAGLKTAEEAVQDAYDSLQ
jgi:multiple sugar transport system substrate-binding protein